MKTLIIGWRDNNIADALARNMSEDDELWVTDRNDFDVTDEFQMDSYLNKNGPWDAIVYTAAVNELMWVRDITQADLVHAYTINVFGFVSVVARHVEAFPQHKTRVVTIVSDAARTPMRGSLMYCSSKAALTGVVRNLARELAPTVTVVGVSPTVVDNTPMTDYIDEAVPKFRGWSKDEARAYESSNIPLGRRVTKQEVADTLLFAIEGPDALTGSIIEITGGK